MKRHKGRLSSDSTGLSDVLTHPSFDRSLSLTIFREGIMTKGVVILPRTRYRPEPGTAR